MYNVIIKRAIGITNAQPVAEYKGCIAFRLSDMGLVSAEFYDGSQKVYKMFEGEEVVKTPMTEEEILATPGLGDYYQEQIEAAKVKEKEDEKYAKDMKVLQGG